MQLGETRADTVRFRCPDGSVLAARIYRAVNVASDPELARKLLDPDPARGLNVVATESGPHPLEVPVLYHDPDSELLVLLLPESYRHRELEARAALLSDMARSGEAIPDYAAGFHTVFGVRGLRELLRTRAEADLAAREHQDRARELDERGGAIEVHRADLDERETALERERSALARDRAGVKDRIAELEERAAQLSARSAELDERAAQLERRERELDQRSEALSRRARAVESRSVELARQSSRQRPTLSLGKRSDILAPGSSAGARNAGPDEHDTGPRDELHPLREPEVPSAVAAGRRRPASDDKPTVEVPGYQEQTIARGDDGDAPRPARAPTSGATVPTPRFSADELAADSSGDSVSSIRPGGTEVQVSVRDVALSAIGEADDDPRDAEATQVHSRHDAALEAWRRSEEPVLATPDTGAGVRLAVAADLALQGSLTAETLQVKLQLHRLPSYPLVTLSVGPSGCMDDPERQGHAWVHVFDLERPEVRELLEELGRDFRFALDVYTEDREPVTRRLVSADLGDNVAALLEARAAHLAAIEPQRLDRSAALTAFESPDYDRFALTHPERASFRDDRLKALGRPPAVLAALSVARRFSKPAREEYLIFERSYSLSRWRQRRRLVMVRALELGLWVGPRLAHIAVSEQLAPSRKQLAAMLLRNFGELIADAAHGLDDSSVRDNWAALREEAATQGIDGERAARAGLEASRADPGDSDPAASRAPELADLTDPERRQQAALRLCREADPAALRPLFQALEGMTRSEAGRVLGAVPGFGEHAVPHLVSALGSRKGFIRQGCALALGVIGGERAVEALCDLLLDEPTPIWREVARALGLIGGAAAAPMVARARRSGERHERISWALAHVVVGEGGRVVESLARGRDPVAAELAQRAQREAAQAEADVRTVRGDEREVTVNRAFSRRFFAELRMEARRGESSPMLLDDADLLEAAEIDDEDGEQLDDSDLIPT